MLKMRWKTLEEIKYSLSEANKIAIISCDFCANLCDTGGRRGIRYFSDILEGWGKEVVLGKSIIPCCSEAVMSLAFRFYGKSLSSADMLVVLSCPTGLKAASLCEPILPLYCPLEVDGGVMITCREDSTLASSICSACGHCVISHTGGICPLSGCPSGQLYGPCDNYPLRGTKCSVDPELHCIWKEIERKGDMAALRVLKELHDNQDNARLPGPDSPATPPVLKKLAGWTIARISAAGALRAFRYLK